jgi:hypothetical protein
MRLRASLNAVTPLIKLRSGSALFSDLNLAENLITAESRPSPINEMRIAGTASVIE